MSIALQKQTPQRSAPEEDSVPRVLEEMGHVLDAAHLPYLVFGGVASSALGRPRTTRDIDILLRPDAAEVALQQLGSSGFETDRLDQKWIYKATKHGTVVDVIFSTRFGIYLDDRMLERARQCQFRGVGFRSISPEDLLIIKAIACDEASSRHWYDALGLILGSDLDWEYVVERALRGHRRVLSLLLYAQSIDYFVPETATRALMARLTGE